MSDEKHLEKGMSPKSVNKITEKYVNSILMCHCFFLNHINRLRKKLKLCRFYFVQKIKCILYIITFFFFCSRICNHYKSIFSFR